MLFACFAIDVFHIKRRRTGLPLLSSLLYAQPWSIQYLVYYSRQFRFSVNKVSSISNIKSPMSADASTRGMIGTLLPVRYFCDHLFHHRGNDFSVRNRCKLDKAYTAALVHFGCKIIACRYRERICMSVVRICNKNTYVGAGL